MESRYQWNRSKIQEKEATNENFSLYPWELNLEILKDMGSQNMKSISNY